MNLLSLATALVGSALVFGAPTEPSRPQCTLAGLSEGCDAFKEYGRAPLIVLPDGTSFANPIAGDLSGPPKRDPEAEGELGSEGEMMEPDPLIAADLRLQFKMQKIWQSLPASRQVSPRFVIDFSQIVPLPEKLASWAGRRTMAAPGTAPAEPSQVSIYWPPAKPAMQRRNISVDEIIRYLEALPADAKQSMRSVLSERAGIKNEMLGSAMAAQQQQQRQMPKATDVRAVFNETQKLFMDEILKGRDPKSLSPAEFSAYNKIRLIRLAKPDPKIPVCEMKQPGGFYAPLSHSFTVCPNLAGYPKAALARLMGHEMAHAIDPCNQTFPLVQYKAEAFRSLPRNPAEFPPKIKNNPDLMNAIMVGRETLASGSWFSNIQQSMSWKDPKTLDRLEEMGFVDIVALDVPPGEEISKETYSCLRDKVQLRENDDSALAKAANKIGTKYQKEISGKFDLPKFTEDLKTRMKSHAQCFQIPGQTTHMCEAMSDAWGAKVLGRYLEKHPPKNKLEKLAPLAIDYRNACVQAATGAKGDASEISLVAIGPILDSEREGHPPDRVRANKIILTDARVQQALGCEPDPKFDCVAKLGVSKPAARPSQNRAVRKSGDQNKGVK